jgi:hypothetical protein
MYSLATAAKAAEVSRPTIQRAIKSGKLSAIRNENGSYAIDPAELARVFPLAGHGAGPMKQPVPPNGAHVLPAITTGEADEMRARISEQAETIRDLRTRLDASEAERSRVQAQLTALLTDQRAAPTPVADPPRTAWGRFLAWRR